MEQAQCVQALLAKTTALTFDTNGVVKSAASNLLSRIPMNFGWNHRWPSFLHAV
jgi:hypothetical protein